VIVGVGVGGKDVVDQAFQLGGFAEQVKFDFESYGEVEDDSPGNSCHVDTMADTDEFVLVLDFEAFDEVEKDTGHHSPSQLVFVGRGTGRSMSQLMTVDHFELELGEEGEEEVVVAVVDLDMSLHMRTATHTDHPDDEGHRSLMVVGGIVCQGRLAEEDGYILYILQSPAGER